MAAQTDNDSNMGAAQETFVGFMSLLKWGGIGAFLIAALVVYLIH
jgi:hypothetical protein